MKHKSIIAFAVISTITGGFAAKSLYSDMRFNQEMNATCEQQAYAQIYKGGGYHGAVDWPKCEAMYKHLVCFAEKIGNNKDYLPPEGCP